MGRAGVLAWLQIRLSVAPGICSKWVIVCDGTLNIVYKTLEV